MPRSNKFVPNQRGSVKILGRHCIAWLASIVIVAFAPTAGALTWVKDGKPVAAIIIPANPSRVEFYAATELQYHVEASTGAKLAIAKESSALPPGPNIFLGHCSAAARVQIDPSKLPGNGYIVKTIGDDLFIAGNDSKGDPLDLDTHEGTLFGVYDLLETELHVRWLWPGNLGEVIPHQTTITLHPKDEVHPPLLWFKHWRGGTSTGEKIWLKRQRFGRSIQPQYGHAFGAYWQRFGKTHPEYLAMTPDGHRGLDPAADSDPQYLHLCVSQPALVTQILDDWKARGTPQFLNVCENDGWAGCACANCLAWDQPDPDSPVPFDKRFEAAREVFEGKRGNRGLWMLQMGSLSDRYAHFWRNVSEAARKIRPDVKVVSYVYDNYRKPPIRETLNKNVLCGLVPEESVFGYSDANSRQFRSDWAGWEKTGCALFLRPNYTLQAQNYPAFYAHTLGEDLKFAMAHHMKGTDFDSLTGKYATQGPSLYMLAAILNHPDSSVDAVLDNFYSAFGPAKVEVQQYFQLWESIYPQYSPQEMASRMKSKRKYGIGTYGPYYLIANEIYTPDVMATAGELLAQARAKSKNDAIASNRIEWLSKGFEQTELILATEKAYEHSIDIHDKTAFRAAYQKLLDFRSANAEYDRTNFVGLVGQERIWERAAQ